METSVVLMGLLTAQHMFEINLINEFETKFDDKGV